MARLSAIFCALSLIVCLATCWLWWQSYKWYMVATYGTSSENVVEFSSDLGGLYIEEVSIRGIEAGVFSVLRGWHYYQYANSPTSESLEHFIHGTAQRWKPLRLLQGDDRNSVRWLLVVPHWFMTLLTGIWSVAWIWRWRRRRKRCTTTCCHVCEYDLRATPERCPECGTVAKAKA